MKTLKIAGWVLLIIGLVVFLGIGIGVMQLQSDNRYEHKCRVYDSSSEYDRYECPNETFYRHK